MKPSGRGIGGETNGLDDAMSINYTLLSIVLVLELTKIYTICTIKFICERASFSALSNDRIHIGQHVLRGSGPS